MQYCLLIYEDAAAFERRGHPEKDVYLGAWRAYYRAMVDAGIYVAGDPLETPETGATVRRHDVRRDIHDGPYANTKEQLGGFIVLELPSFDAALEWAARCPAATYGAVEVRPLAPVTRERVTGESPRRA